jgi:peptide/nickel transport system permease protein
MLMFIVKRVGTSIALLFLSTIVIFLLMRVIPGDPTITKLGGSIKEVDQSTLDHIRAQLGLDKSWPEQYAIWIKGLLHGDLGSSYFSQFSVTTLIGQRIGATLLLAVMAMVIGLAIAVPASVAGAIWPNRYLNAVLSTFAAIGIAIPTFVIGIALIILIGVELDALPTQGYVSFQSDPIGSIKSTLLPALTLGIGVAAVTMRILRASLIEVGSASFVRTARGKGLFRRQVVTRHELPNASIPAITQTGIIVAHLVGGAVIIEYVFARPGLGSLLVDSVFQRDYAVMQSLVLLTAAAFIVTSLIVDVILGFVDPRLRAEAVS